MTTPKSEGVTGGIVTLARRSRQPVHFLIQPEHEARLSVADALGIDAVRKLRFEGELRPEGARDWRLSATLGATVVQPCVVTLAPVTTRIDASVSRAYLADFVEPEESEVEMPEDETAEALPDRLDLDGVMLEALALSLPDYPRAPGVELARVNFAEPGVEPMTDDDAKPMAALAAFRDRLRKDSEDDSGA